MWVLWKRSNADGWQWDSTDVCELRERECDSVCNGNDLWSVADAMPMHVYADAAVAMVKVKMKYIEWYMNMNLRCAAIAIYIETCACVDETAAANYS